MEKENLEVFWQRECMEEFFGKEILQLVWEAVRLVVEENLEVFWERMDVFLGKESKGLVWVGVDVDVFWSQK